MSAETGYPPLPTEEEAASARECARVLFAHLQEGVETQQLEIIDQNGAPERVNVPASALRVFAEVLRRTGEGSLVQLDPQPPDLSVHEAASRFSVPYGNLMEAINKGGIPFYKVGSRYRVLYSDMVEFEKLIAAKREQNRKGLDTEANEASTAEAD